MISEYIITTNAQKVLKFLLLKSGKPCYEREIARGAKISYGSANNVLNQFYKKRLVKRKVDGRMCYYFIDVSDPYIRELKILNNLLILENLVEKLKQYTQKIVLYGSWAEGTDTEESDIDLFIIGSREKVIKSIVAKWSYSSKIDNRKIQAIIKTPADLLDKDSKNKVFMDQVKQGKILWEKEINEDNL